METQFRTYIFHDHQIEFSEEFRRFKNLKTGATSRIELKESKVFIALIENANRLCTKDQLLDCWAPSVVTESALTRVISLLRSHLKEVGAEHIITTDTKRGYILETKVSFSPQIKLKEALPKLKERLLTPGKIIGFTTVIVSLLWLIAAVSYKPDVQIPTQYDVSHILNVPKDVADIQYQYPNLSPDGNWLIYTRSNIDNEAWSLEWLDLKNGEKYQYAIPDKHLVTPVWRDENSFAFHAYSDSSCEIRLAKLENNQVIQDHLIYSCNEQTKSKSLAWKDKLNLFITDSHTQFHHQELYEVNIESLTPIHIKSQNEFGQGIYSVTVNQNREQVALLYGGSWRETTIEIFNIDNLQEPTNQLTVNLPLFSLGWLDDGNLIYQNDSGGISVHDIKLNTSTSLSFPSDAYFSNPVVGGGNKLAMISGDYYSLALYDVVPDDTKPLKKASFGKFSGNFIKALAFDNNSTYFVSDEYGMNQIYRSESGSITTVSEFNEPVTIFDLLVSEKLGIALITNGEGVTIFDFNNDMLSNEVHRIDNANSACLFGDELILAIVNDNVSDLYAFNLQTFEIAERITHSGALHCKTYGATLSYSRQNADGIWQYVPDSDDQQIVNFPVSSVHSTWYFQKNILWYITEANELKTYDFLNGTDPQLIENGVLSVYPGQDTPQILAFALAPTQVQLLKLKSK